MNNIRLEDALKLCNISCKKCLDTKKLWKERGSILAALDGRGIYDIFHCNLCSSGHWMACSHSNIIMEGSIHVFHFDNNNDMERLDILINRIRQKEIENLAALERDNKIKEDKRLSDLVVLEKEHKLNEDKRFSDLAVLEKENKIKEDERLRDIAIEEKKKEKEREEEERILIKEKEREEEKKEKEEEERILFNSVDELMDDGLLKPLWGDSIEKTLTSSVEDLHVNVEIGKLVEKVYDGISASNGDLTSLASLIKDLKFDLTAGSEKSVSSDSKCLSSRSNKGYPVYLLLKVIAEKEKSNCSLLEWCGFSNNINNISLKYVLMSPKNNAARNICNNAIEEIQNVKLKNIVDFMKN